MSVIAELDFKFKKNGRFLTTLGTRPEVKKIELKSTGPPKLKEMRQRTQSVSPISWGYGILLSPLTSSREDSRHVRGGNFPPCQWGNFPPRHVSGENLNVIFAWPRTYLRRMVGLAWCPPHSGPSASNVKIWSCSDPCSVVQSNPRCLSIQQARGDSNMI